MIQIHCCIWKTNILSPVSNKNFHNIVKPQTVKHVKVGFNSTRYQMLEQQSLLKGPYTINVSNVGKTDRSSILIQEAEARPHANRTDMKSRIKSLIDDGKMPNDHAEGIEEFSKYFSRNVDYTK